MRRSAKEWRSGGVWRSVKECGGVSKRLECCCALLSECVVCWSGVTPLRETTAWSAIAIAIAFAIAIGGDVGSTHGHGRAPGAVSVW